MERQIIGEDAQRLVNRIITAEDVLSGTTKDEKTMIRASGVETVDTPTELATGATIKTNTTIGIITIISIIAIIVFFVIRRRSK